jgi:hypothetical protein
MYEFGVVFTSIMFTSDYSEIHPVFLKSKHADRADGWMDGRVGRQTDKLMYVFISSTLQSSCNNETLDKTSCLESSEVPWSSQIENCIVVRVR